MNEDKQKRGTLSHSPFVTPAGFKPTTSGTGILRSIQLNYEAFVTYCAAKVSIFVGLSKCVATKYVVLNYSNSMPINGRRAAGCCENEESEGRAWALWCTLNDQYW